MLFFRIKKKLFSVLIIILLKNRKKMLVIIGKNDVPLYEVNLKIIKKDINITHHFALHSSLDSLDEIVH